MHIDSGTDVTFINEYIQIILRNLDSIVKNNFLLEAKNVIIEKSLVEKNNVGVINLQLTESLNELREKLAQVESNNNNSHNQYVEEILGEKRRIQEGFNMEMSAHAQLKSNFEQLHQEKVQLQSNYEQSIIDQSISLNELTALKEQIEYNAKLTRQKSAPKSKVIEKETINIPVVTSIKNRDIKIDKTNSKSGGTF